MVGENNFDKSSNQGDELSAEQKLLQNEYLVASRRPAARDGHTALSFVNDTSSKPYMLIFGGDRHQMPFNDAFLLDLECELFSKTT